MSGISGIWHLDSKPLPKQLLEAVAARLLHRGPHYTGHWINSSLGLSANVLHVTAESLSEVQPALHHSGCVLVFDGRVDNREELIADLSPAEGLTSSSPDSQLALLAYLRFGKSFAAHIVGDFALALFDPRSRELLLARDVIGIRPLYFYQDANLFIFGSEVKALLAHPGVKTRPNESYLAVTMMGGMPPGDLALTHFDNIFSLPPAHVLTVTPKGVVREKYWDFDVRTQIRYRSPEEYFEGFRHHFQRAVRRRLRSAFPVAITVSGGLDSSSIFCVAQKLRQSGDLPCPEIFGLTHVSEPGTPADERVFVKAIERDYEVKIAGVPVEFRGLREGIRPSVWAFEAPLGDIQWYNNSLLLEAAKSRDARVMLTGHWGDQILFQTAYLVDLFRAFKWKQVRAHLGEFGNWIDADPKWFRKYFYRDLVKTHIPRQLRPLIAMVRAKTQKISKDELWFTEQFRKLAAESLARYYPPKAKFASMHARGMYEDVRAKYYVQAMELHNKAGAAASVDMTLPVLDRDLLLFLMSIPGEVVTEHGVHRGLLRKAMHGILPAEIIERRTKANYTHLENQMMQRQYDDVCGFFSDDSEVHARGYVDAKSLRSELLLLSGKIEGRGCRAAWSLGDLMGLEIWLQEFFVHGVS